MCEKTLNIEGQTFKILSEKAESTEKSACISEENEVW